MWKKAQIERTLHEWRNYIKYAWTSKNNPFPLNKEHFLDLNEPGSMWCKQTHLHFNLSAHGLAQAFQSGLPKIWDENPYVKEPYISANQLKE